MYKARSTCFYELVPVPLVNVATTLTFRDLYLESDCKQTLKYVLFLIDESHCVEKSSKEQL